MKAYSQSDRIKPLLNPLKTDLASPISAIVLALLLSIGGCASQPQQAIVLEPDVPDYLARDHRIEEPIDLYIEPRIPILTAEVVPRSDTKSYPGLQVVAGPALEKALMTLSRQHFARATPVERIDSRPTLTYRLLSFQPTIVVEPGGLRSQLTVSARLAIQVSLQAASGERLFSATAIGTSHISDSKLTPAGRGQLVEIVTRNAIIDAMYEISKIFDHSNETLEPGSLARSSTTASSIETFDDVILYLRTLTPATD